MTHDLLLKESSLSAKRHYDDAVIELELGGAKRQVPKTKIWKETRKRVISLIRESATLNRSSAEPGATEPSNSLPDRYSAEAFESI